jgi:hypothetical protein
MGANQKGKNSFIAIACARSVDAAYPKVLIIARFVMNTCVKLYQGLLN